MDSLLHTRDETAGMWGGSVSKKEKIVASAGISAERGGENIKGEYYAALMEQLYDAIKAKRPHLASFSFAIMNPLTLLKFQ